MSGVNFPYPFYPYDFWASMGICFALGLGAGRFSRKKSDGLLYAGVFYILLLLINPLIIGLVTDSLDYIDLNDYLGIMYFIGLPLLIPYSIGVVAGRHSKYNGLDRMAVGKDRARFYRFYIISFIIGASIPYLTTISDRPLAAGWWPFWFIPVASYPAFLLILYSLVLMRYPGYWDDFHKRLWGMFLFLLGYLVFWIPQKSFAFYYLVGPVASPYTETSWAGFFLYMVIPALVAVSLATQNIGRKTVRFGIGVMLVVMIFAVPVASLLKSPSPPDFVPSPPGGIEGDVSAKGFPYVEPLDPEAVKRDLTEWNLTTLSFDLEDFRPKDRQKMLENFISAGFNVTVEGSMVTVELGGSK